MTDERQQAHEDIGVTGTLKRVCAHLNSFNFYSLRPSYPRKQTT